MRAKASWVRRRCFLVHLVEDLRRDLEGAEGRRHAAIDRGMHQHLLDLVAAHSGIARGTDVQLELVELAHAHKHGDGDHAARLAVEAGTRPDRAPGIFHQEVLEVGVEGGAVLRGACGVRRSEHGFADLLAALVAVFAHVVLPVGWRLPSPAHGLFAMSGRRGVQGAFAHAARAHGDGRRGEPLTASCYSGLMPAASTTSPHCRRSFSITALVSLSEPPAASSWSSRKRPCTWASCKASLIAALSLMTISAGVLGGALIAFQVDEINCG